MVTTSADGLQPRHAAHHGRVLVVEDDRALLEAYTDVLLAAGFDVVAASDGAGALHALDTDPFDVVLTDLVLPGRHGRRDPARRA